LRWWYGRSQDQRSDGRRSNDEEAPPEDAEGQAPQGGNGCAPSPFLGSQSQEET
jgi:hypothetical protein